MWVKNQNSQLCLWSAERLCLVTEHQAGHQVQSVQSVVISALLYGCKTWCPYQRYNCQIDQLQPHHLCFLMKITWQDKVPNTKVLSWAGMPAVSTMVMSAHLHWAGHIARMPDGRLPKNIICGQLSSGAHQWGGQQLQYKDTVHMSDTKANIGPSIWEDLAWDCIQWRNSIKKRVEAAEKGLKETSGESTESTTIELLPLLPHLASPVKYVASNASQGSVYTATPKCTVQTLIEKNHHHLMRWIACRQQTTRKARC